MAVSGMCSQHTPCCLNAVGPHCAASRVLRLADLEIEHHKFVKDYEVPKDGFVLTNLIETDGSAWWLKARSSPRSREARPSRACAVPPWSLLGQRVLSGLPGGDQRLLIEHGFGAKSTVCF